jgi:uncharacterized protein (TIGR02145 family)
MKAQETGTVTDYDGNIYGTIKIGNQWWMTENLRTTHYYDGTAIPQFTGTKTISADDYKDYYTYPNNSSANVQTYGLLYSWNVICDQTAATFKQLLPAGWAVADTTAWAELATYLGGKSVAGGKLKTTANWNDPNTGATNESGFKAVPAGDCNTGGFTVFGQEARFWTPQLVMAGGAGRIYMTLGYNSAALSKGQYRNVNALSIRLVKNILASVDNNAPQSSFTVRNSMVNDELVLLNINEKVSLQLYTINGALVKSACAGQTDYYSWNISDLPKGIYILSSGNNTLKTKIIKQ